MKDREFLESLTTEEVNMVKELIINKRKEVQKQKEIHETFEAIRRLISKFNELGATLMVNYDDYDTYEHYDHEVRMNDLYY